jgi:peptidoglycan/xylan/chitin deacetylase (PgdA/CDA1 family)
LFGIVSRLSLESKTMSKPEQASKENGGRDWSLPILTYHRIGNPRSDLDKSGVVLPREFERQVSWLKANGYNTITASHLNEVLHERAEMPPSPVLLTFDDGYEEICENALPALVANGLTATAFIVTGCVGKTNKWDEDAGWGSIPIMSADQIRQWAQQGIDFGAHSETHPDMIKMTPVELASECSDCAQALSEILGRRVTSFAYPHGRHNATVRSVAARYFDLAFGCEEGLNTINTDRFRLRRTMTRGSDGIRSFSYRILEGRSPLWDLGHIRAELHIKRSLKDLWDWIRSK